MADVVVDRGDVGLERTGKNQPDIVEIAHRILPWGMSQCAKTGRGGRRRPNNL
jgi:hypothetical protein